MEAQIIHYHYPSIYVNINNGSPPSFGHPANVDSASVNSSWNSFSTDIATYGAGLYLGGWGNTLTAGTTGSIGTLSVGGTKGVQNAGKNFSGSLQEFRYYSHDISQSVFNDFVMNPESIEGNNITGSESSFDIVNFRAPLGNELENKFTSSQYLTQYDKQYPSVHPAITGSSPLVITASFYDVNQATINDADLTSSYDVTFNVNSSTRTYSDTNVETYFLDQPQYEAQREEIDALQEEIDQLRAQNVQLVEDLTNTINALTNSIGNIDG